MDRQAFIRSLVKNNDGVAKQTGAASSSSAVKQGERRSFIASLKDDTSRADVIQVTVSFTMAKLREFKGTQMSGMSFKKEAELPRKRPNYDSSNRKMYANPVVRVKQLDFDKDSILWCCFGCIQMVGF